MLVAISPADSSPPEPVFTIFWHYGKPIGWLDSLFAFENTMLIFDGDDDGRKVNIPLSLLLLQVKSQQDDKVGWSTYINPI